MNLVNLVVHGLSAISVFAEAMLTRILLFFVLATSIGALVILVVVALRLFTDIPAPGWATSIVGSVAVICLQALLLTMMAAFLVLSNRSTIVPPPKHAKGFIDHVVTLFSADAMSQVAEPLNIAPSPLESPVLSRLGGELPPKAHAGEILR